MNKLIKLYGERNTNTNYLGRLVELNLVAEQLRGSASPRARRCQEVLPGNEWVLDLYFYLTFSKNLGWKHSLVKPASKLKRSALFKNKSVAVVTITKNPYSWLLSLYRNPYHRHDMQVIDFENFLSLPWKTTFRDNTLRTLESPVELWNLKNESYLKLAEINALNITSEEISRNPEAVVMKISEHFLVARKSSQFIDYDQSTKGENKTSDFYRDYYMNERWKVDLSAAAVSKINRAVNRRLMSHFDYDLLPAE
jgi:hypothetical protein